MKRSIKGILASVFLLATPIVLVPFINNNHVDNLTTQQSTIEFDGVRINGLSYL
jgi:hypothetical protein